MVSEKCYTVSFFKFDRKVDFIESRSLVTMSFLSQVEYVLNF